MRLWELPGGRPIGEPLTFNNAMALAFSPDGTRLAVAGGDDNNSGADVGGARAANRSDEQLRHNGVMDLAFSPDGTSLASGGTDRTVLLREPLDRQADQRRR